MELDCGNNPYGCELPNRVGDIEAQLEQNNRIVKWLAMRVKLTDEKTGARLPWQEVIKEAEKAIDDN